MVLRFSCLNVLGSGGKKMSSLVSACNNSSLNAHKMKG